MSWATGRGRTIGNGADFRAFDVREGIDFQDFGKM